VVSGPVDDGGEAHRLGRLPPGRSLGAPSLPPCIELRAQDLQLHRLLPDQQLELTDALCPP
jgi:hypothetical protein